VIRYRIHDDEFAMLQAEASRSARWDGGSNIRDRAGKVSLLDADNLVGMIGEWAISLALTGDDEAFRRSRAKRARRPWEGDGGDDLDGLGWDVKSSMMRYSQNPSDYHLLVRAAELKRGIRYAAAFVCRDYRQVWLPGWATAEEVELSFPIAGRAGLQGPHAIAVPKLHPMPSGGVFAK
jgi:hypothetical protein